MRRSDHGFRADDRRIVSHHSPRPAMAVFLADPLSIGTADLAKHSVATGLGLLRDLNISDRQHVVLISSHHSGLCTHARSDDRLSSQSLWNAGVGVARDD